MCKKIRRGDKYQFIEGKRHECTIKSNLFNAIRNLDACK